VKEYLFFEKESVTALKELKNIKASGADNVVNELLKNCIY